MKSIIFLLFIISEIILSQVKVVEDSIFSNSVNSTMKYYVILPAGYDKTQERFTTLYLLHGYSGDYTNWVKLTELVRYAKKYNFIIITPDAKNSWYSTSISNPQQNFEDYIMNDLINHIDSKYRTLQTKYARAIAGLSMGGYGAAKFALKYPQKFFFAGCISPSIAYPFSLEDTNVTNRRSKEMIQSLRSIFGSPNASWNDNDVFSILDKANPKSLPFFYLSVGSHDALTDIVDLTYVFGKELRQRNIAFEFHETAGGHDWKFWDKEIEIVLSRIAEFREKKR